MPAVCLVPRGVQEGFDTRLREPTFQALTNRPVTFQVYASATRTGDRVGDMVDLALDEISVLPRIQTVLRFGRKGVATEIPVQLAVRLTETGTLDIYCDSLQTEHRWPLQFDIRQEADLESRESADALGGVTAGRIEVARRTIRSVFGADRTLAPEQLRKQLEAISTCPKKSGPHRSSVCWPTNCSPVLIPVHPPISTRLSGSTHWATACVPVSAIRPTNCA